MHHDVKSLQLRIHQAHISHRSQQQGQQRLIYIQVQARRYCYPDQAAHHAAIHKRPSLVHCQLPVQVKQANGKRAVDEAGKKRRLANVGQPSTDGNQEATQHKIGKKPIHFGKWQYFFYLYK